MTIKTIAAPFALMAGLFLLAPDADATLANWHGKNKSFSGSKNLCRNGWYGNTSSSRSSVGVNRGKRAPIKRHRIKTLKLNKGSSFKAYSYNPSYKAKQVRRERLNQRIDASKRHLQKAKNTAQSEGDKIYGRYGSLGGAGYYEGFKHRNAVKSIKSYKQQINTLTKMRNKL